MPGQFSRLARLFIAAGLLIGAGACAAPPAGAPASNEPTSAPISALPTYAASAPEETIIVPTPVPEKPTAVPEIQEKRRLTLEWPATIRSGDGDVVRLTLEVDASGDLVPTAETAGHETTAKIVQIPDLFKTHHVLAEARLDLAGVQVVPDNLVSQTLLPGQRVDFSWSVKPESVGTFRGNVWFYLRFIPIDGGPESERTISAQPIEIRSVDLFGLTGAPARVVGALGALVGSVLGLDNLIGWVWNLLRRKKSQ
jgi:hypothetical protein